MRYALAVIWLAILIAPVTVLSSEQDLVKHYGQLPQVRSVSISPSGTHIAFIQRHNDLDVFVVVKRESNTLVASEPFRNIKARSVSFATDEHILIRISETRDHALIIGKWEDDSAALYNLKSKKLTYLPSNDVGLNPVQSGRSGVVGIDSAKQRLYMPAVIGLSDPVMGLLNVSMKNGRARVHRRGTIHTRDWFVSQEGEVLAREDFNNDLNRHSIFSYISGKPVEIFRQQVDVPQKVFSGLSPDNRELIYLEGDLDGEALYRMSLSDGEVSGPEFLQRDRDIDRLIFTGASRHVLGVELSGAMTSYEFSDPRLKSVVSGLQQLFKGSSVDIRGGSRAFAHIVFSVSGNEGAEHYYLYDSQENQISMIAQGYPHVANEHIGKVEAITYTATDGLEIPAILTWPVGSQLRTKLPLLVLPHGGPASYDKVRFDWWAQYFARLGYLVLQPNFRGSTGYGYAHQHAGAREWGKRMQDDVSDGVHHLVELGYAAPDRVCIMGGSYGGYAALAGGGFTPELYRCVVSVAGVSDLPRMLTDTKVRAGSDHWVVSYWEKQIGDSKEGREALKDISPINAADQFVAPVLLLHGTDDTVVLPRQSRRMEQALRKAGKDVSYVEIQGEDHWLSTSETRERMLREIARFLDKHNPPH